MSLVRLVSTLKPMGILKVAYGRRVRLRAYSVGRRLWTETSCQFFCLPILSGLPLTGLIFSAGLDICYATEARDSANGHGEHVRT
jgi:hypothetical protein